MYSRALDKAFSLRFAILLPDREKYRGDSGMSECSIGKQVFLRLVKSWQSDAHFQFRNLTEREQKTKRINCLTPHSVKSFHSQRPPQISQQFVIRFGPIKTFTEKNNFAIYLNNNETESINKTLESAKYILSGTTSEMSKTRLLPDIHRFDNILRINLSHN
jgi:hypothetical protein